MEVVVGGVVGVVGGGGGGPAFAAYFVFALTAQFPSAVEAFEGDIGLVEPCERGFGWCVVSEVGVSPGGFDGGEFFDRWAVLCPAGWDAVGEVESGDEPVDPFDEVGPFVGGGSGW